MSICIEPSHREKEKEKRNDGREKKYPKQAQSASTTSTIGPCPTYIQISTCRMPGTESYSASSPDREHPKEIPASCACVYRKGEDVQRSLVMRISFFKICVHILSNLSPNYTHFASV